MAGVLGLYRKVTSASQGAEEGHGIRTPAGQSLREKGAVLTTRLNTNTGLWRRVHYAHDNHPGKEPILKNESSVKPPIFTFKDK